MPKKLYDVLDVSEDASAADIQRAYRKKVKKSHPDVSDEPDAAETFQLIVTANEVLTDPEERERYDDLGHEAYMDWFGEDGSNGGSGGGSASSATASDSSESGTDARDGGSVDDSGGTADTSSSSSGTAAGGSDGVDFGEQTSGSSGDTSGGGSSGSPTSGATGSSSASTSSSSNSSGASATASSSSGADSSSGSTVDHGSTRGSTGAVSESAVAEEAERTRKQWQAASRSGGPDDATSPWSTSSSQGEHLAAERIESGIATKIRSRDAIEMTVVMLVAYPVFLFATVWDGFPMAVRVTVGVLTVVVLLYTLTEPVVGVVVFGVWSALTPLLMVVAEMELLSVFGLFALTVTWVPFLLALLLILAMPE